jgi:hypothetical protein
LIVCHLHPNIHQHSWKLLEINPTAMLYVLFFQIYAGIDGVNLAFNSRQQTPTLSSLLVPSKGYGLMWNKIVQDIIQVHKSF